MKEEIKYIAFSDEPKVIAHSEKIDYSELSETVKVNINTTKRDLSFYVYKGYSWKSKISRYFLDKNNKILKYFPNKDNKIAKYFLDKNNKIINIIMLYKYMTDFKTYMINEVIRDKISIIRYFYFIFKIILWLLKEE